jgi:hypothetical protein
VYIIFLFLFFIFICLWDYQVLPEVRFFEYVVNKLSQFLFFYYFSFNMSDNDIPALNTDGTLKDASEIEWIDSPSEDNPMPNNKRKRHKSTDTIQLSGVNDPPSSHREAGKL